MITSSPSTLTRRRLVVPGRYGVPAAWLLLAVLGQIAQLRLTKQGPVVAYQSLAMFGDMLSWQHPSKALLVLAFQAFVVLVGLYLRRRDLPALTGRPGAGVEAAVALVLVFAVSARFAAPNIPLTAAVQGTAVHLVALGNALMVALTLPAGSAQARRLLSRPAGSRLDPVIVAASLWVVMVCALLAVLVYQRHPHVPDETAYLLHARYFAAGMVSLPAPLLAEAFSVDLMMVDGGRWYSVFPPGWPAMLALGVKAHAPWLVNPLLAGASMPLAYALLRHWYPRATARLAVVLLALSPWYLFLGMSLMSHHAALFVALLAALAVVRSRRSGATRWSLAGGACLGALAAIRPMDALAVALLLGLWSLGGGRLASRIWHTACLALTSVVIAGMQVAYNRTLTGSVFDSPLGRYFDRLLPGANALGFGPDRGLGWVGLDPYPGHTPLDALRNAQFSGFLVDVDLFGWASGSVVFIAVFLARRRFRRGDRAMLTAIAVVASLYALYWFNGGPDFGARYWFLMVVPLAALTARGIVVSDARVRSRVGSPALIAAAVLSLGAMLTFMPWRATDRYYHYRSMRPDLRELARQHDFGASLVLVRGSRQPDYHSAVVFNPLDLSAPVPIYVWDRSAEVQAWALRAYRERPVWIVDGPSVTGDAYRIAAGPLRSEQVPAFAPAYPHIR